MEWQEELGLNFFDYSARNYDSALGRWMNEDPLTKTTKQPCSSVNPLNAIITRGGNTIKITNENGISEILINNQ